MALSRYAVVEFDDGVTLIPEKWMTPRKTHCYWPPYKTESRVLKAVENQENTAENWTSHSIIKILATTKKFKRGREKCSQALEMSDINTDSDATNVRSKQWTKQRSVIIGPFPPTDFDDVANFYGNDRDSDVEKIENTNLPSTANAPVRSQETNSVPPTNQPSIINKIPQSNATNEAYYRRNEQNTKTILRALANIDLKVDDLTAEVRDMRRAMTTQTTDNEIEKTESKILKAYPLETESDLEIQERRLSTDTNYKNNLIKDLAIFVQSDVKSTVSKLMQEIMTNALAAKYSFHGAHKKKAFEKLKLFDVVSSVIRCRFTNPLVVNKDIIDPIKSWLRHAPARSSREQKKAAPINANDLDPDLDHESNNDEASNDAVNNTVAVTNSSA